MGSQTPTLAIPYPVGTDRVMDGDNAMQAMAESVESLMLATWQAIPGLVGTAIAGYVTAGYAKIGQVVELRGVANYAGGWGAGATLGTLPAGSRPTASLSFLVIFGSGTGIITVSATGTVVAVAAGTGAVHFNGIRFRVN